jgi:hypothetical protein
MSEEICQWLFHCDEPAIFIVNIHDQEVPVCERDVKMYGLNDGDLWRISNE